ncbi:hypothetical protein BHAP_0127 [Bifidobacterium hapali]|uniref:Uncharacterized protein n=1 Tax=Bifidobacterium hapali TaxID=1630172 RepID=A0A261G594_9BIFI|nr:hypothetical protein [Bifidobacterium hapali]OZG66599.1 hypothetical protein BHAP_0127 [Bifidobacterium hapali]
MEQQHYYDNGYDSRGTATVMSSSASSVDSDDWAALFAGLAA